MTRGSTPRAMPVPPEEQAFHFWMSRPSEGPWSFAKFIKTGDGTTRSVIYSQISYLRVFLVFHLFKPLFWDLILKQEVMYT
jgi:hypothetical protein